MENNYDANCRIDTKWNSNVFMIDISGRLTYENVQTLRNVVEEKISDSEYYIIDLSKTTQMDSTGLGLFVTIVKHYLLKNSRMVLINPNPIIKELFAVSRLNSYFASVEKESEAISLLYDNNNDVWQNLMRV